MLTSPKIKLVVFDWEGTLVDFGGRAAVEAILETFARHKLMLTLREARAVVGMARYEQVRTLLEMPAVSEQFQIVHGRRWTEADVHECDHDLGQTHAEQCRRHCDLVPYSLECCQQLRSRGIKIGTTSDLPRAIADEVWNAGQMAGFESDCNVSSDDVPSGRPAPWMLFRVMQQLDIFPPACVVKIGDTVSDIEEGVHAGCWSLGVTMTGSEVGLSRKDWEALDEAGQRDRLAAASRKLTGAGAHYVIPSLSDLPATIDHIEARLETGEKP